MPTFFLEKKVGIKKSARGWGSKENLCRLIALTIFYASFVQILIFSLQMLAALTRAG